MMKARNLRMLANGDIDMEINHHSFGWIPFTASINDVEPHGRKLYEAAVNGELGNISDDETGAGDL